MFVCDQFKLNRIPHWYEQRSTPNWYQTKCDFQFVKLKKSDFLLMLCKMSTLSNVCGTNTQNAVTKNWNIDIDFERNGDRFHIMSFGFIIRNDDVSCKRLDVSIWSRLKMHIITGRERWRRIRATTILTQHCLQMYFKYFSILALAKAWCISNTMWERWIFEMKMF